MTSLALSGLSESPALRITIRLPRWLPKLAARLRNRRDFARLARLSPRLIRDAGLDPDVVYDAVADTWDEVRPGEYRKR